MKLVWKCLSICVDLVRVITANARSVKNAETSFDFLAFIPQAGPKRQKNSTRRDSLTSPLPGEATKTTNISLNEERAELQNTGDIFSRGKQSALSSPQSRAFQMKRNRERALHQKGLELITIIIMGQY